MQYFPAQFGRELKSKILYKRPVEEIGEWAHTTYINYMLDIDLDFRDLLLTLNTMELGPEFALLMKN